MSKRTITAAAALALVACGGGGKQADSPGSCPAGTVLKGSDCVASDDDSSGSSSGGDPHPTGGGDDTPSTTGEAAYDHEAIEKEFKRAARQIKANCGGATDGEGKATGPWGATKVTIVLGRNGHVKQVTIPAPYDGKPVGVCAIQAFKLIQYTPYPGNHDASVDWDIELVQPKP